LDAYQLKEHHHQNHGELQKGIWKNDWKFWVHGIGCRLTHISTSEPLEWDAPDVHSFRFDWFWHHLLWRCQFDNEDPIVAKTKDWVTQSSEVAVEQDLVSRHIIQLGWDGIAKLTSNL
jgi:hypothetical protein